MMKQYRDDVKQAGIVPHRPPPWTSRKSMEHNGKFVADLDLLYMNLAEHSNIPRSLVPIVKLVKFNVQCVTLIVKYCLVRMFVYTDQLQHVELPYSSYSFIAIS